MPDHATFLAAIRDQPESLGPRLVFADWLEEHGDCDRAEFIRVQIEAEHHPVSSPRRLRLEQRAADLTESHGSEWTKPISSLIPESRPRLIASSTMTFQDDAVREWTPSYRFRGGFIEDVSVTCTEWRDHGQAILDATPVLDLTLIDAADSYPILDDGPDFGPIRGLHLYGISSDALAWVTELIPQRMPQVRHLHLDYARLDDNDILRLAESEVLDQITHLTLRGNDLTYRSVAAIVRSPTCAHLEHLDLSFNLLSAVAVQAIARSPYLTRLISLDLESLIAAISNTSVEELLKTPNLPSLHMLNLNGLGAARRRDLHLPPPTILSNLTELRMAGNYLNRLDWLPNQGDLSDLRILDLSRNDLEADAFPILGKLLTRLHQLDLSTCNLDAWHVKEMVRIPVPDLYVLSFSENGIGDLGIEIIADNTCWPQLTTLDVRGCRISDSGARALLQSTCLKELRILDVRENEICDELLAALAERYGPGVML